MSLHILGQSVEKADNDLLSGETVRLNEDAFFYDNFRAVISDGAGGTGLFANKWAQKLIENIPEHPFNNAEEIDHWIESFWEEFYQTNLSLIQQDHWQLNKFEDEGSSATLAALWQIADNKFIYNSYGDSCLFIYNTQSGELRIQENLNSLNSFTNSPPLLNWKYEKSDPDALFTKEFSINPNEVIILSTDGLAMFLYSAYLSLNNLVKEDVKEMKLRKIVKFFEEHQVLSFEALMKKIYVALQTKSSFSELMQHCYQNYFLPNDDYTLLWIECNSN